MTNTFIKLMKYTGRYFLKKFITENDASSNMGKICS